MNQVIEFIKKSLQPIYNYLFPIRTKGTQIQILSRLPRHCKIISSGTGNSIYIGSQCIIEHTNILILGNNCRLNIEGNFCMRGVISQLKGTIVYLI